MSRVTIEVLAERLGLSTASVSYALNGQAGVSDATRARVLALADQLGWRPNVGARALSRARADAVGLLLPRGAEDVGAEPYYMALLAGIESALAEAPNVRSCHSWWVRGPARSPRVATPMITRGARATSGNPDDHARGPRQERQPRRE